MKELNLKIFKNITIKYFQKQTKTDINLKLIFCNNPFPYSNICLQTIKHILVGIFINLISKLAQFFIAYYPYLVIRLPYLTPVESPLIGFWWPLTSLWLLLHPRRFAHRSNILLSGFLLIFGLGRNNVQMGWILYLVDLTSLSTSISTFGV